jgi:hypothetical protein
MMTSPDSDHSPPLFKKKAMAVAASVAWNFIFITSAVPNVAAISCCIAGVTTGLATGRVLKKRDGVLERHLITASNEIVFVNV